MTTLVKPPALSVASRDLLSGRPPSEPSITIVPKNAMSEGSRRPVSREKMPAAAANVTSSLGCADDSKDVRTSWG